MLLVVDANVVFSSLLGVGKPLRIFEINRVFGKFELIAPEYLFFEIEKRIDKISQFTQFSKEELLDVISFIEQQIELIPLKTFEDNVGEAQSLAPHEKDIPYIALSLKFDCMILSGDKGLKRKLPDKVINPSEALELLFSRV